MIFPSAPVPGLHLPPRPLHECYFFLYHAHALPQHHSSESAGFPDVTPLSDAHAHSFPPPWPYSHIQAEEHQHLDAYAAVVVAVVVAAVAAAAVVAAAR